MDRQTFLKEYLADRMHTDCMKWDGLEAKFGQADLIGMWVADMDFRTSKYISEALMKRVQHGIFGYTIVPDEYYEILSRWMESRYGAPIKKEWVRFVPGCVTGLAYAINCYTLPGDACLIMKPVYYPFFNVITNNHRKLVDVDLDYTEGRWSMNDRLIEEAIVRHDVKLVLLCSPHNPAGALWSAEELDRLFSICRKHHVLVVSDEIHQDFVIDKEKRFVPALAVADGKYHDLLITVNSASKTFNFATLLHAHLMIPDETLRKKYDAYASGINRTEVSVMGMYATMAGYQHGTEWLNHVVEIVRDNYEYLKKEMKEHLPNSTVCCLDATYLVMVDLSAYCDPNHASEFVQNKAKLGVDYGEWFGDRYSGFIRMNLATDPEIVKKAVRNLVEAAKKSKEAQRWKKRGARKTTVFVH